MQVWSSRKRSIETTTSLVGQDPASDESGQCRAEPGPWVAGDIKGQSHVLPRITTPMAPNMSIVIIGVRQRLVLLVGQTFDNLGCPLQISFLCTCHVFIYLYHDIVEFGIVPDDAGVMELLDRLLDLRCPTPSKGNWRVEQALLKYQPVVLAAAVDVCEQQACNLAVIYRHKPAEANNAPLGP